MVPLLNAVRHARLHVSSARICFLMSILHMSLLEYSGKNPLLGNTQQTIKLSWRVESGTCLLWGRGIEHTGGYFIVNWIGASWYESKFGELIKFHFLFFGLFIYLLTLAKVSPRNFSFHISSKLTPQQHFFFYQNSLPCTPPTLPMLQHVCTWCICRIYSASRWRREECVSILLDGFPRLSGLEQTMLAFD
jgi:quinol-cytochrome oxidoreductase complex cytochrome b subunit